VCIHPLLINSSGKKHYGEGRERSETPKLEQKKSNKTQKRKKEKLQVGFGSILRLDHRESQLK